MTETKPRKYAPCCEGCPHNSTNPPTGWQALPGHYCGKMGFRLEGTNWEKCPIEKV